MKEDHILQSPASALISLKSNNILVLGVGNILLHDEGIGVHVVRELEQRYDCSENVTILDGGTLGMRLLDALSRADIMIVADTLNSKNPPGTLSRLTRQELQDRVAAKNSMHQVSFLETIAYAEFLGILPEVVLVGCQPENLSAWGIELSAAVAAAKPEMMMMVVDEIRQAGGQIRESARG